MCFISSFKEQQKQREKNRDWESNRKINCFKKKKMRQKKKKPKKKTKKTKKKKKKKQEKRLNIYLLQMVFNFTFLLVLLVAKWK